jgi:hypothetical protein
MAGVFKVVLHASDLQFKVDEIINVFGYKSTAVSGGGEEGALADQFIADVVPALAAVLHARTSFNRVEVFNVTNGLGYSNTVISPAIVGSVSGDSNNGFMAWSFVSPRKITGQRNGYKRLSIVAEASISDGEAASGILTALAAAATAMSTPLNFGLIDWFPQILHRPVPNSYPWSSRDADNWSYQKVTTQNSRKR